MEPIFSSSSYDFMLKEIIKQSNSNLKDKGFKAENVNYLVNGSVVCLNIDSEFFEVDVNNYHKTAHDVKRIIKYLEWFCVVISEPQIKTIEVFFKTIIKLLEDPPLKVSISNKQKTYIMKDSINGLYKIGKSVNPKIREKTLQSEKPSINIVKIFDKNIEKELHKKYTSQRVRGEWFSLTNVQLNYICKNY